MMVSNVFYFTHTGGNLTSICSNGLKQPASCFCLHPSFLCALESMTFLRRLFKQLMFFSKSTTPKTPVTQPLWMSCWESARSFLGLVRFGDERWSGNWEKTTSHENKTPIRCVYIYICFHRSFKGRGVACDRYFWSLVTAIFGRLWPHELLRCHFSRQAQYLVVLECHFSWQAHYLVMLEGQFFWQAQHLVKFGTVLE